MITKFKLFERDRPFKRRSITKYNEGDFVLLNLDEIKKNLDLGEWNELPDDMLAKILCIDNADSYDVQIFNSDKNGGYNVTFKEILRLLTPTEIKIYKERRKLYNKIKKYNL